MPNSRTALDLGAYKSAAAKLRTFLSEEIGHLFQTKCPRTGMIAEAKYFLWVKTASCQSCGKNHDLFPNHLIAQDVRHTANVFACGHCGCLIESENRHDPGPYPGCGKTVPIAHRAGRNRSRCIHCNGEISYPREFPPEHRMFAIEYHLPEAHAHGGRKGRLFKAPDSEDLSKFHEATVRLQKLKTKFIPSDAIPKGDETERLHRWGYRHYAELFNPRQLLGLELSCRWISGVSDERVREALSTNLSDLLRYQNMLCRYDPMALKSLDVFSVHGFPVGLIACESNILARRGLRPSEI